MNLILFPIKSRITYLLLSGLILFYSGCKKEEMVVEEQTATTSAQDSDDTAISLEGDLQISDFIWEGLNTYYYWQEEVPNLADSKAEDEKAYAQFIWHEKWPKNIEPILSEKDSNAFSLNDSETL